MELKIKSTKWIIAGFVALASIFFIFSDQIVGFISTLSPIMILFVSILISPTYLLFIYFMYKSYGLRGCLGGFLISTAIDLISLPHILLKSGEFSKDSFSIFTDTVFWGFIPNFLKQTITLPIVGQINLGVFLVYIVVSTLLIIISLMIVKKKTFKKVFNDSI